MYDIPYPIPSIFGIYTPRKTNMEPENHPFGKENDLPNLHFGVQNVSFRGCTHIYIVDFYGIKAKVGKYTIRPMDQGRYF